jgi:hypothetical protein
MKTSSSLLKHTLQKVLKHQKIVPQNKIRTLWLFNQVLREKANGEVRGDLRKKGPSVYDLQAAEAWPGSYYLNL